jgi:hypothetical protein
MIQKKLSILAAWAVAAGLGMDARGAVNLVFNYADAAGQGFNDAAQGAARRAALEQAGVNFVAAFSFWNATIFMDVTGTATGTTLAAAGSNGDPNFVAGFGVGEVIRNKILSNGATDLNGAMPDGTVNVNFATINWELNINATPSAGAYDWYSTMYHEFTHAVGFSSGVQTNNMGMSATDGFGTTGANPGSWNKFDQYLTNSAGVSLFTGFDLNEANYEALLIGGASPANGLFFNGPTSGLVGLYTPATFETGSSGSHLDDQNAAYNGLMMLSATAPGPSARLFSGLEQNMLRDLGYNMIGQIIPEPSSVALIGCALGLLVHRRRRV